MCVLRNIQEQVCSAPNQRNRTGCTWAPYAVALNPILPESPHQPAVIVHSRDGTHYTAPDVSATCRGAGCVKRNSLFARRACSVKSNADIISHSHDGETRWTHMQSYDTCPRYRSRRSAITAFHSYSALMNKTAYTDWLSDGRVLALQCRQVHLRDTVLTSSDSLLFKHSPR